MANYLKNRLYSFLRNSQKYTGTDNVYLAEGSFWLTFGQISAMAIAFLSTAAFANLLDPVTYGNYKYVLSLAEILEITTLVGLGAAISQSVARNFEGSFYTGFKIKFKWGLLGSLAAVLGAVYYWIKGNDILPIPLLLTAIFLPLTNAAHVYTSFLGGKKLFNFQIQYAVISQIVSTGSLIAVLFLTKNIFWLIAVYFASSTITNLFFYFLTKFKFQPNKKEDSETLPYGKHLSIMGIISSVASRLDKLLVFGAIGPAQLAVYSFASIIPQQIESVLGNVESLAFPKLAARSKEEIRANLMGKFWKFALLTAAIMAVSIIAIPPFYKIFLPRYSESITYSQVLILSFVSVPVSLLATAFKAKMMKRELYLMKAGAFIKIGLLVILIPLYGVWGAVIAAVGTEMIKSVFVVFLFVKKF